ncbi:MAG: SDR family oxidoreductase [Alphaproteobacteria bacterium]|nr:SDR family oxidoreductase [Alphaproteobacteria bacterium]
MKGLGAKPVIVTGAGGGIGRATALRFAEAGAKVGVFDLDATATAGTVDAVKEAGGEAWAQVCDITDRAAVDRAVADFADEAGPLYALVNNAGWDQPFQFLETDEAFWRKVVEINYFGPLHMHHACLPGMVERGEGRVINIASDAARVGSSGEAVYAGCKAGIIAFGKTVAREVARSGVTVNAVCPGPTETSLLDSFFDDSEYGKKLYEGLKRAVPMKRLGQPEDLPGIVAFLASAEAGFITGQVISVSGGLTMHG